jgi:glutathione S-transferase
MALKFYMTPGSCSTGLHILLEELDLPFEAHIVNLPAGEHLRPAFVAINPKSTIPVLVREDGSALTEWQAIAWWLARRHPRAKLLPDDAEGEVRVMEVMNYVVGTMHMQGFARIFTTQAFAPDPADHAAVRARGCELVAAGFAILAATIGGRDYVADRFSIADAALFYVVFWADKLGLEMPENLRAFYERMRARPAVRRVLAEEGYR